MCEESLHGLSEQDLEPLGLSEQNLEQSEVEARWTQMDQGKSPSASSKGWALQSSLECFGVLCRYRFSARILAVPLRASEVLLTRRMFEDESMKAFFSAIELNAVDVASKS